MIELLKSNVQYRLFDKIFYSKTSPFLIITEHFYQTKNQSFYSYYEELGISSIFIQFTVLSDCSKKIFYYDKKASDK